MLDLRGDPVVTVELLELSVALEWARTGQRPTEALLTYEQAWDVYSELQGSVRFTPTDEPLRVFGVALRTEETA